MPPGIRTLIRRYTVAAAEVGNRSTPKTTADGFLPATAVALTCRQPYLEITPICQSRDRFAMPPVSVETVRGVIHGFATAIGPESAHCVRILGLVPSGITSLLDLRRNLMSGTVHGR